MTSKTIKIQYLDDSIKRLTYVGGKSDWIDLAAAETVTLKAGEFRLIHLGVAMKLPEGYEAHIAPRSSTFKNFGILQANSVGVVDSSYKGSRIAQFRIMEQQPTLTFEEGPLDGADRGGFGSTGI